MRQRTSEDYYRESKRIREEVLQQAELLKGNPLHFTITNGITMRVEITKSDLKTIVSKASRDNKFNAIKNALAKDIPGFLKKSEYIGWRTVKEGKHEELRFNGLACRTNRGYPSEAEFKSASILASRLPDQPGLLP